MDNDEVLFQWCMLTADVSDADATVVYTRNASQAVDSNLRFLVCQRMARTPQAAEKEESATLKSSPKGHSLDPANNYYDTVLHTKSYCMNYDMTTSSLQTLTMTCTHVYASLQTVRGGELVLS